MLKDIRRQTRRQYSAEEKIRIVLEGLRGEETSPSCAAGRASPPRCIMAGRRSSSRPASAALARRAATSGEVKDLRRETAALKEVVADLTLENRLLKKSMNGDGEDEA